MNTNNQLQKQLKSAKSLLLGKPIFTKSNNVIVAKEGTLAANTVSTYVKRFDAYQ